MYQRFADAIADAGPAVVGTVGVNGLFPVFRVERRIADDHRLLGGGFGFALRRIRLGRGRFLCGRRFA